MRYTVSDTFKNASCLSSWLRGTQYAVSNIYVRVQVVLIVGYAVRGTQWLLYAREKVNQLHA